MIPRFAIASLATLCLTLASAWAEDGAGEPAASAACECCQTSFVTDDCCKCCDVPPHFLGMLPSDPCFDRFISPLSNPFFFEDPRSLTEARAIFLDNDIPDQIGGGDAQVWAGQLRGRLSDRLSLIAPRLGHLEVNQKGANPPAGFMSAPLGLKYNFVRDMDYQFLATAGITYFVPGSQSAISNLGDGDFHFFLTAGKEIFDSGHWLSGTGFRIPADGNWGTQLWYWSNQWDYELPGNLYPLVGINWFHWMRSSGNNGTGSVTGFDLINLPAGAAAGNDVVTGVVGAKWKPSGHLELGCGYEFPLTDRTDILHDRIYADLILRY